MVVSGPRIRERIASRGVAGSGSVISGPAPPRERAQALVVVYWVLFTLVLATVD